MSPQRVMWLLLLLSNILYLPSCLTYACPPICQCSLDTFQCTRETQLATKAAQFSSNLKLSHLQLVEVPSCAFKGLINVTRIEISQSNRVRTIKSHAFLFLHSLTEILIHNIYQLKSIEKGAFTDLPKLKYLSICNTGITQVPDFTTISSLVIHFILEMGDNMDIESIAANAFQGLAEGFESMKLGRNGFKEINAHAFNGTKLGLLSLKDNKYLQIIHEDAFEGASGPNILDVSSTALSSLPPKGLGQVRILTARSAYALKTLPPLESLLELLEATLTYPSHCCAFHTWRRKQRENALFGNFSNFTRLCDDSDPAENMESTEDDVAGLYDINFQYPDLDQGCGNSPPMKCTPEPDAFNPCEDLLGYDFLRSITWVITVFAVTGNLAVLAILLTSHQKLSVSRFLMCNLAFADFCMGIYLLLIACMDYHSRKEYYNHANDWQTGTGCAIAGFLTVFATELSVYTLTMITLERWHTITNAMHLNKRLRRRHVAAMMGGGWVFSLLTALLPVLGVSSYSKVSICLPMDIENMASQVYVVVVLILNVASFLAVCYCYVCIYLSVYNPDLATHQGDAKIAKRMAVLIFTDFLCMAPISFFAISAALHMPLITVSNSKILLVIFYPINSLCNPFLYTIFTRAFRRDVCLLLSRCSCCCSKAEFYRTQGLAGNAMSPKNKASTGNPHSLRFYAYHIKMQGCFLNKGTT